METHQLLSFSSRHHKSWSLSQAHHGSIVILGMVYSWSGGNTLQVLQNGKKKKKKLDQLSSRKHFF
jgi:hypothetical protein